MDTIIFTHFVTPTSGASRLVLALDHLGAWVDAELGSLEDLLDISGHEEAIDDIMTLHGLHLDAGATPGDMTRLLESAQASLVRLLTRVRTIPLDAPRLGRVLSDFDVWVCRSEARLEDILATLHRALAA
jgi:hypothetical protein